MFDTIAPRYEVVNTLMTFGLDRGWRRRTVAGLALAPGSRVLDLACGTGDLVRRLEHEQYVAVGVDVSAGMLAAARVDRSPLLQGDGLRLPFKDAALDGCVSGFALRNFTDLAGTLGEIARVLRPGGRASYLDVDEPTALLLRAANRLWCSTAVPAIGALLSDAAAYRYLPRSYAYLPPRASLLALVAAAGFEDVTHVPLSGGITQLVTATRAGLGLRRPLRSRQQADPA